MISRSCSVGPKSKLSESKMNGCEQSTKPLQARIARNDGFLMGAPGTKTRNDKALEAVFAAESAEAAEEAGLHYISDDRPGYTRRGNNGEFEYLDTQGKPIRDEQRLLRIKRLAIPPAYTDVWICPSTNGHIQAMGRDARRRKQYRYHERWRAARDENKYDRMVLFGEALPKIRKRVEADAATRLRIRSEEHTSELQS